MPSRIVLALAIAAWTLITWGGRIRLLTDAEQSSIGNWTRIGGSIVVGLVAAAVLVWAHDGALERWALTVFAVWSSIIWLRSLLSVWAGEQSLAFKLVHTVLATGFFLLSFFAIRVGWFSSTG